MSNWYNNINESSEVERGVDEALIITPATANNSDTDTKVTQIRTITCPSCAHNIQFQDQVGGGIMKNELSGLPAGVKFDPNEKEILEHLEAKVMSNVRNMHPLIDHFIPTLEGDNGICYTHPEKLPGVKKDGQIRHFFHRPSKAYTTGTRKRRKVHTDEKEEGRETRWHKTGKTRPVFVGGSLKGFKKILVLYTNFGRQKKPEKTNWVMHQYHLGINEEEKDGELVVSKVFYQTQPRQCGTSSVVMKDNPYEKMNSHHDNIIMRPKNNNNNNNNAATLNVVDYYNPTNFINYDHVGHPNRESSPPQLLIPNLVVQGDNSFIQLAMDANKARMDRE